MVLSSALLLFLLWYFVVSSQACNECDCCEGNNACDARTKVCKNGCIAGYWGGKCTYSCSEHCVTCTSDIECTECKSGFWGTQCLSKCGKGCVNNTCLQSGKCDCKSTNFRSGFCSSCLTGKHGDYCDESCPTNCGSCYSNTQCTWCKYYRYYGSRCQFECSAGCSTGTCSKDDGTCSTCSTGFTGNKCDSCISGKHGANCDLYCPEKCTVCSSYSNCTECKLGYYGSTCTNQCPSGCNQSACDMNGICTHGCKVGLNITFNCEKCAPGNWGDSCQYKCPHQCLSCTSTETCTKCINGYYGPKCSVKCPTNCVASVCNYNGECYVCKERHFGPYCESQCSVMCLNGTCSMLNGHCFECRQGFHGDFCNIMKCEDGFYGINCKMTGDSSCITCLTKESGMYGGCTKCTTAKKHVRQDGHTTSEMIGATFGAGLFGLLIGIVFTFVFITWKRRRKERKGDESNGNQGDGIEIMATQDRDGSNNVDYENEMPAIYEELKERDERTYSQITSNQQMSHQAAEYINY